MRNTKVYKATKKTLVYIPRKEYEEFLLFKSFAEFSPTPVQKKSLASAERNLKFGKTISYHELRTKLGVRN